MIQIIQLLEERNMSFSFCLNKTDVLVLCGMTLLYQSLELKHDSKLMKDIERLTTAVLKTLQKNRAAGICDLKRVARMLVPIGEPSQPTSMQKSPGMAMAAPPRSSPPAGAFKKGLPYGRHTGAAMSETDLLSQQEKLRRMTMPSSSTPRPELYRTQSRASFDHTNTDQSTTQRDHRFSIAQIQQTMMRMPHKAKANMDYLSLSNSTTSNPQPSSPTQNNHTSPSQPVPPSHQPHNSLYPPTQMNKGISGSGVSLSEWEALLGAMDGGQINVYDAIYGGPALSLETPNNYTEWASDPWDLSSFTIGDLELSTNAAGPQSVLSLSDESLSSGDDLSNEIYLGMKGEEYQSGLVPHRNSHDGPLVLDGIDMGLDMGLGL